MTAPAPSTAALIGVPESRFAVAHSRVERPNGLSVACTLVRSAAASAPLRTVVALHGGPAFTHGYIEPLQLLCELDHDTAVLFYDQAGCGDSSSFGQGQVPAELLTIAYYVDELDAVIAANVAKESQLFVYGSSWGTVLAQEWAVANAAKADGERRALRGLILDGAFNDSQEYIQTQWSDVLPRYVPEYTLNRLRELERQKAYESDEYKQIDKSLGARFTMRVVPKPQCWLSSLEKSNAEIYTAMQGPSEFTIGGVLEHWSIKERIGAVRAPALVLAGEFDTMSQRCQQSVVDALPSAWPLVTIEKAAHCKLIDAPQACCQAIAKFLRSVSASIS